VSGEGSDAGGAGGANGDGWSTSGGAGDANGGGWSAGGDANGEGSDAGGGDGVIQLGLGAGVNCGGASGGVAAGASGLLGGDAAWGCGRMNGTPQPLQLSSPGSTAVPQRGQTNFVANFQLPISCYFSQMLGATWAEQESIRCAVQQRYQCVMPALPGKYNDDRTRRVWLAVLKQAGPSKAAATLDSG